MYLLYACTKQELSDYSFWNNCNLSLLKQFFLKVLYAPWHDFLFLKQISIEEGFYSKMLRNMSRNK